MPLIIMNEELMMFRCVNGFMNALCIRNVNIVVGGGCKQHYTKIMMNFMLSKDIKIIKCVIDKAMTKCSVVFYSSHTRIR